MFSQFLKPLFQLKTLLRNDGLLHSEELPTSSHVKHTPDFKSINSVHPWLQSTPRSVTVMRYSLHKPGEKGTAMRHINTSQ